MGGVSEAVSPVGLVVLHAHRFWKVGVRGEGEGERGEGEGVRGCCEGERGRRGRCEGVKGTVRGRRRGRRLREGGRGREERSITVTTTVLCWRRPIRDQL